MQKLHKHQWQGQQVYQRHIVSLDLVVVVVLVVVAGVVAVLVALVVSLLALVVYPLPFFASLKIHSFNLFMYFSLPLHAASTRFGSFVTFCNVLSMFILKYN